MIFTEGGKIKLILGPMFSGKSTRLLNTVKKYQYKKMRTVLVKYGSNTEKIVTHEQVQSDALACFTLKEQVEGLIKYDVIGIDEGQFFPDLVEQCEYLCNKGRIVIVSALSGNFKMEPFHNVSKLISKADEIKLLKAYCYYCKKSAGFTLRTIRSDSEILIGSAESYKPVCKMCYINNNYI